MSFPGLMLIITPAAWTTPPIAPLSTSCSRFWAISKVTFTFPSGGSTETTPVPFPVLLAGSLDQLFQLPGYPLPCPSMPAPSYGRRSSARLPGSFAGESVHVEHGDDLGAAVLRLSHGRIIATVAVKSLAAEELHVGRILVSVPRIASLSGPTERKLVGRNGQAGDDWSKFGGAEPFEHVHNRASHE